MGSTTKATWYWDIIRELLAFLDKVGYTILGMVYKVFYSVATATIISGDVIRNFYGRMQLILGILMMFKLAMSILNIIINPDLATDPKQGGTKIVTRVVTALFMLLLVIPINLPLQDSDRTNRGKALSLNSYVYDHGILFGFLYKFQDSMMRENIMGRLILGTTGSTGNPYANDDGDKDFNDIDANNLSEVGRSIAAQVAKTFIRPNVEDESEPYCYTEDDNPSDPRYSADTPCPNTRCPTEVYNSGYTDPTLAASSVVDVVNIRCDNSELGKKIYAFTYMPLIGLITSGIMAFIIVGFTVDIAVRAVKLAMLRLIAPIPILSYIDPKSQKDGAFGNWTKSLISTYVDLFVRLAIIFFGAFLIQSLFSDGTFSGINSGNALVDMFSVVFIIIGILVFMKQAPAFLKNALGIKSQPMGNVGLAGLLGGAAMALGGGGAAGFALGMMQGATSAADAAGQNKAFSPFDSWKTNRDQMAKIRTGDKDARGGMLGGMMDRALYNTRERQLGKKGLSYANMELAKANHYKQQEELQRAQINRDLAYEQMKAAGVYSAPVDPSENLKRMDMKEFAAAKGYNINDRSTSAQLARDYAAYARNWQDGSYKEKWRSEHKAEMDKYNSERALWEAFTRADKKLADEQTRAAKIEKNYKNIGDSRKTYGVDPRLYDEYTSHGYRAGGHGASFDPYSEGAASDLDDMGANVFMPEIGDGRGSGGSRR